MAKEQMRCLKFFNAQFLLDVSTRTPTRKEHHLPVSDVWTLGLLTWHPSTGPAVAALNGHSKNRKSSHPWCRTMPVGMPCGAVHSRRTANFLPSTLTGGRSIHCHSGVKKHTERTDKFSSTRNVFVATVDLGWGAGLISGIGEKETHTKTQKDLIFFFCCRLSGVFSSPGLVFYK